MRIVLPGGGVHLPLIAGAVHGISRHVRITGIGGTSAGGLVALAFAARLDLSDLISRAFPLDRHLSRRWAPWAMPPSIYHGRPIQKLLKSVFEDLRFGDVAMDCAVVTANVSRSQQLVMHSLAPGFWDVKLRDAAYATMAVPGLFPPAHFRGDLLVDGGVTSNLAADDLPFDVDLAVLLEAPSGRVTPSSSLSYLGAVIDTALRHNESEDVPGRIPRLVLPRREGSLDLTSLDRDRAEMWFWDGVELGERWVRGRSRADGRPSGRG